MIAYLLHQASFSLYAISKHPISPKPQKSVKIYNGVSKTNSWTLYNIISFLKVNLNNINYIVIISI